MVLLDIPFKIAGELLRHKAAVGVLKALSSGQPVTAKVMMQETGMSWKAVWSTLQVIVKNEYAVHEGRTYRGTEKIRENSFLLNLRDSLADDLLKWRSTRQILHLLHKKPESHLMEISTISGIPYPTVKAVLRRLRKIGIVRGGRINPKMIVKPSDQLSLVPRRIHQQALRHFLSTIKTYYPKFNETIILFGDASWGIPSFNLDIAVLIKNVEPDWMLYIAKKLVYSSRNVTTDIGVTFNLSILARYLFPQISMNIVEYTTPLPRMIADGICIYGHLPRNEDLFELGGSMSPRPEEEIRRLLRKGYIRRTDNGKYAYTEKAIEKFRKRRSRVFEKVIQIDGKDVRLVGVAPPRTS